MVRCLVYGGIDSFWFLWSTASQTARRGEARGGYLVYTRQGPTTAETDPLSLCISHKYIMIRVSDTAAGNCTLPFED